MKQAWRSIVYYSSLFFFLYLLPSNRSPNLSSFLLRQFENRTFSTLLKTSSPKTNIQSPIYLQTSFFFFVRIEAQLYLVFCYANLKTKPFLRFLKPVSRKLTSNLQSICKPPPPFFAQIEG